LTLSDVAITNFKFGSADNTITFSDSNTRRNTIRESVVSTLTFGHRLGEINLVSVFNDLIFSDIGRCNFQIGEAEDDLEFYDELAARGTIKESLEDDLTFEQVLEHTKTLNLSVVDCFCLSDLAQSVEYASVEDTITFSDEMDNHLWELLEQTLTFDQEVEVEGIDFLDYPCSMENQENTIVEDNTLLGDDPFEEFELEFGDFGFDIGEAPDTSRGCGDGVYLNYPAIEQELVFSDSVSPFGDRGNTVVDELGWTDYTVGFKIITRR
jgi:hypothetical protein